LPSCRQWMSSVLLQVLDCLVVASCIDYLPWWMRETTDLIS
jgi:hypothetical protein